MNNSANSAIQRQWRTILQKRLTSVPVMVGEVSLPVFGGTSGLISGYCMELREVSTCGRFETNEFYGKITQGQVICLL